MKTIKSIVQHVEDLIRVAGFGQVRYDYYRDVLNINATDLDAPLYIRIPRRDANLMDHRYVCPTGGSCGAYVEDEGKPESHVAATVSIKKDMVFVKMEARHGAVIKLAKRLGVDLSSLNNKVEVSG